MCSQLWSPIFSVPLSCRNRVGVRVSGYNSPAFESGDTKRVSEYSAWVNWLEEAPARWEHPVQQDKPLVFQCCPFYTSECQQWEWVRERKRERESESERGGERREDTFLCWVGPQWFSTLPSTGANTGIPRAMTSYKQASRKKDVVGEERFMGWASCGQIMSPNYGDLFSFLWLSLSLSCTQHTTHKHMY